MSHSHHPPVYIFVITGASRGFGRALACAAAERFGLSSSAATLRLLLVARSEDGLQETCRQTESYLSSPMMATTTSSFQQKAFVMDLGDLNQLEGHLQVLLSEIDQCILESVAASSAHHQRPPTSVRLIWIQNAGTLGPVGPSIDMMMTPSSCKNHISSLQDFAQNVNLNVTSCCWMSAQISRHMLHNYNHHSISTTIVQISSLVAVADLPTLGLYSIGKTARDKYHTLLTKESPTIRTLNYAPGPLETDMVQEIRDSPRLEESLKPNFGKDQVLDPLSSGRKLMKLLERNDFTSGAHIDYYDLPPGDDETTSDSSRSSKRLTSLIETV